MYNYAVFRAILPPEAQLEEPPTLGHFAMNVVVHPNTVLGRNVRIWHGVTIAVSDSPGGRSSVRIGDDVMIGTGTVIISREQEDLIICAGVKIGSNSTVTRSITTPGNYSGNPAKLHVRTGSENT
ncbi:LbetaH domain-containing protein [Okibacterium fritillariae]|uniref:serine acetyltransferase n=1 Tax=Okibacterium fritillariae TaxID=123320 RepID=UPI0013564D46|nr:serine acetyltransferase [Okibacterium fritillariae]